MIIISYSGSSGRIDLELNAHEFLRLSELLEKIVPCCQEFFVDPDLWFREGILYNKGWVEFCAANEDFKVLLKLVNQLISASRHDRLSLNPLHINCLYQLIVDGPPINEFKEVGLILTGIHEDPIWVPVDYRYSSTIPLSQLKEEGVDRFDREALVNRLRQ